MSHYVAIFHEMYSDRDKSHMESFDVKMIAEGSMIQITHYGDAIYSLAMASRKEASEISQQHDIHNFMVDPRGARIAGNVSELYGFHSHDPLLLARSTCLALVYDIKTLSFIRVFKIQVERKIS